MPYRDAAGHFISREEAIRQGLVPGETPPPTDEPEVFTESDTEPDYTGPRRWVREGETEVVMVDTGRGNAVPVPVGTPFEETLNRLSDEYNYGGYFRVFLNGSEIVNPEDSPDFVESGMRIAITAYDKVG